MSCYGVKPSDKIRHIPCLKGSFSQDNPVLDALGRSALIVYEKDDFSDRPELQEMQHFAFPSYN